MVELRLHELALSADVSLALAKRFFSGADGESAYGVRGDLQCSVASWQEVSVVHTETFLVKRLLLQVISEVYPLLKDSGNALDYREYVQTRLHAMA